MEIYRKSAGVNTSIEHQAFYSYRKNPFSVATLFVEIYDVVYIDTLTIDVSVKVYQYKNHQRQERRSGRAPRQSGVDLPMVFEAFQWRKN